MASLLLCRHSRAALLAAGFPVLLSSILSCGGDADPALPVVRDSAGIRIVELPTLDPGRPPDITLTPVDSSGIHSDGKAAHVEYTRIAGADVGRDGRIYVLDAGASQVFILGSDGSLEERFGGPGEGPGEFRSAAALHVGPAGRIVVGERMPWRVHQFDGDGNLLDSWTLPLTVEGGPDLKDPPGPAMVEWGWPASDRLPARLMTLPADPTRSPVNRLLRIDPVEGRIERVLLQWEEPGSLAEPAEIFAPRYSWTGDLRGRVHISDGASHEIRTLDGEGRVRRILRRAVPRRPVASDEGDRALRRFRSAMSRGGAPAELVERVAGGLRVAPELPAIQEMWTDRATGELWVAVPRVDPERGDLVAKEYHVYGAGGGFLGRAIAPDDFVLLTVRERRLYGSVSDALDVPHLRIFQAGLRNTGGRHAH